MKTCICGAELKDTATFCGKCGRRLDAPAEKPAAEAEAAWTLCACGARVRAGAKFCGTCGRSMTAPAPAEAAPAPAPEKAPPAPLTPALPPRKTHKALGIILGSAGVLLAAFLVVLFTVILPAVHNRQIRQQADELLAENRLTEAEALYAQLPQDDEIRALRTRLFKETRVIHCAVMLKNSLIHPDSLQIREAAVCEPSLAVDDDGHILDSVYGQPDIILHYTARSQGGYTVNKYVLFDGMPDGYCQRTPVDDLESDPPSYLSNVEKRDYVAGRLYINVAMMGEYTLLTDSELADVNTVVSGTNKRYYEFAPFSDLIPRPTPRPENGATAEAR